MRREFHIRIGNGAAPARPKTLDGGPPPHWFARCKNILGGLAVSALAIGVLIAMIMVGSVIAGIVVAVLLLIVAWLLIRASLARGRA